MNLQHSFSIQKGLLIFVAFFAFQLTSFSKCVYQSPLQIKVTDFGNKLKWSTAEEQNIAFFVIQKSSDGISFEKIGDLKGAGYSKQIISYRFTDFCLPETTVYYRLLHYAPDGSFTTSATFYMGSSPRDEVRIMAANSTMTNKELGLTLASRTATSVDYEVKNNRGQVVYRGTQTLNVGNNILSITCDDFQNGEYDVVFKTATDRDQITIHKVDLDKVPNIEFVVAP